MVLIGVLLVGCASMGQKIDQTALSSVTVGETTKQEMIQKFGDPISITLTSDGNLMGVWSYISSVAFGPTKIQQLSVIFDANEKVVKYNLNDSNIRGIVPF